MYQVVRRELRSLCTSSIRNSSAGARCYFASCSDDGAVMVSSSMQPQFMINSHLIQVQDIASLKRDFRTPAFTEVSS